MIQFTIYSGTTSDAALNKSEAPGAFSLLPSTPGLTRPTRRMKCSRANCSAHPSAILRHLRPAFSIPSKPSRKVRCRLPLRRAKPLVSGQVARAVSRQTDRCRNRPTSRRNCICVLSAGRGGDCRRSDTPYRPSFSARRIIYLQGLPRSRDRAAGAPSRPAASPLRRGVTAILSPAPCRPRMPRLRASTRARSI